MPAEAASRRQVALLPNLRAHRLAALRGVRAHVLRVRSARQNGYGLSFDSAQDRAGRTFLNIPSRWTMRGSTGALIGYWSAIFNRILKSRLQILLNLLTIGNSISK